ncbi:hypothetical protein R1flu_014947 [Riccia fluitans]|uniref:Uncharacterized protein n=1 Tax=Riccia fluitans TaxID=41844 RepID=A0ABD1YHY2_9MARC
MRTTHSADIPQHQFEMHLCVECFRYPTTSYNTFPGFWKAALSKKSKKISLPGDKGHFHPLKSVHREFMELAVSRSAFQG